MIQMVFLAWIFLISRFTPIICHEYSFRMQQHLQKLLPNESETKRLRGMEELFLTYIETHGVEKLSSWSKEQLCSAKFIGSSPNLGCERAGNLLDAFFDTMALAMILNRTLVVHWTGRRCDGALELQPWILTYDKLVSLRQQKNCVNPMIKHRFDTNFMDNAWCCYDDINLPNSTYFMEGSWFRKAYEFAYHRMNNNMSITDPITARASVLFSNRQMGSYEAFGFMALFSLRWTSLVTNLTQRIELLTTRNSYTTVLNINVHGENHDHDIPLQPREEGKYEVENVIIGVHARHSRGSVRAKDDLNAEKTFDITFHQSLRYYLPNITYVSHFKNRTCTVLIATDRMDTLDMLKTTAIEFGCIPKFVEMKSQRNEGEHGPWSDGIHSMADWYLVSHAHYFIGTYGSTFSDIILNVIAARRALIGRGHMTPYAWAVAGDLLSKNSSGVKQTESVPIIGSEYCAYSGTGWTGFTCALGPEPSEHEILNTLTAAKYLHYSNPPQNPICHPHPCTHFEKNDHHMTLEREYNLSNHKIL